MIDRIVSPAFADIVLIFILLEAIFVAALAQAKGRSLTDVLLVLAAGGFLFAALRASLAGAGKEWIAVALTGALIAHAVWLVRWLGGRK